MPNIKSSKKRVKVTAARSLHNKAVRTDLRTEIKKANLAIENGSEDKVNAVRVAIKKIDKAVSKGILHKNTAAHKKSALDKKLAAGS